MDYFVSVENIPYFHWQIDLLLESFELAGKENHLLGLENRLFIAVAHNEFKNTPPRYFDYADKLVSHKNMLLHENYGLTRGHRPLNKIRSLVYALENNLIKQPFAMIHPDMMMVKPIEDEWQQNVVFQDILMDREEAKEQFELYIEPFVEEYILAKTDQKREEFPSWIPLGDIVVFRDVPITFFYRWLTLAEELVDRDDSSGFPSLWRLNKTALVITLYEHLGLGIMPCSTSNLEQGMLEYEVRANFIHYQRGMPPVFSKHNYRTAGYDTGYTAEDPSVILLENNPTPATDVMNKVVRSFKGTD